MRPMQAPVPPSDRVVLEFGSTTVGWGWAGVALFGLGWLGIGLGAALSGSVGVGVVLLVLGGLFSFVAFVLLRIARLRMVLTTTRLICPRVLWGWDVVDLRSVAGVGLRFRDPPPRRTRGEGPPPQPDWRLALWLTDVSRVPLPLAVPGSDLPLLPPAPDADDLLVLGPALAESWPGQVAVLIVEQVTAASAPGPSEFDEHHYERTGPVEQFEKAFWSPDGSMGLLR